MTSITRACRLGGFCYDLSMLWYHAESTGKFFSEVLIYLSINPQYVNKLFNDLRVQYKKIPRAEHAKNMLFTQIVLNV